MGVRARSAAIAGTVAALALAASGSVLAAGHSSDETALQPTRHAASPSIERRVDALLRRMTLQEKLDQLTLLSDAQISDAEAAKPVGGVFSLTDPVKINHYQHLAVEKSRLHIPILFAFDTIHGFRTIFPIPLGTASSFDPSVAQTDHRIGHSSQRPSGSSRSTARWSMSRTSRAGGASPRPPARTRT